MSRKGKQRLKLVEPDTDKTHVCRAEDFYRILTEPDFNLIIQQTELLKTEGIELVFEDSAIREISKVAEEVNQQVDNIGARRLHTVLERIVEDISFSAPEKVCHDLWVASSNAACNIEMKQLQGPVRKVTRVQSEQD